MNNQSNNKNNLIHCCEKVLQILTSYYNFSTIPNIQNFLLAPPENSNCQSQILFKEHEDEFYIGIQFAKEIHLKSTINSSFSAHHIAVIAEELSHFKFLSDVVENDKKTSLLILETLGEIDRFLCIMHWNSNKDSIAKMNIEWKNIHQICDYVFTGERFQNGDKKLYIEAENLAFKHLKEAFADKWDCSYFNFSNISAPAKIYLHNLRAKFLA